MDKKSIAKVNKSVYKKFPEMHGAAPRVEDNLQAQAKSVNTAKTYRLTYHLVATHASGHRIPRQVRVVANTKGQILRISTSR